MAMNWMKRLFVVFLFVLMLVVVASVLYGTWNYTIPRLMHSVGSCENDNCNSGAAKFTAIDYGTAWVFMFMLLVMFAPGTFMSLIVGAFNDTTAFTTRESTRRRSLSAININPVASTNFDPLNAFRR